MYCSTCAAPIAPGLSYCNRCGASLKEASSPRRESNTGSIAAFLTAIVLIAVMGLGMMLGGALTLTRDAHLGEPIVGFFMLFAFLIVAIIELMLGRQLSRLLSSTDRATKQLTQPQMMPAEFHPTQPRTLTEPVPSVTENTTRTLDYSRNETLR